jgi:hypothetical protein
MNIITCTGYGSTGSSVVSDLLNEFEDINSYGDFEFRFLQDPHGLRDLEYGLFENNNRLNTGYHIKQFIKYSKFLSKSKVYNYEKYFNGNFKMLSDEFINKLIDVQWQGYWHQDIIDEKPIKKFFYYLERVIQKKVLKQRYSGANYYKNIMYYSKPNDKDFFYDEVKIYMNKLISSMQINEKYNHLVLDQLVPPDHNETYLNYFDNLKVIIVDRDPRDLYLLEKYQYKHKWVPYGDINKFIQWFKLIRQHRKSEVKNKNILYINFEDFIYDYDKTIDKVIDFCKLDKVKWIDKKKYFNPDISIKNTKKWVAHHVYPEARKEVDIIETELKEFLVEY